MTQQDLEKLFSQCGKIITSRILYDTNTGQKAFFFSFFLHGRSVVFFFGLFLYPQNFATVERFVLFSSIDFFFFKFKLHLLHWFYFQLFYSLFVRKFKKKYISFLSCSSLTSIFELPFPFFSLRYWVLLSFFYIFFLNILMFLVCSPLVRSTQVFT